MLNKLLGSMQYLWSKYHCDLQKQWNYFNFKGDSNTNDKYVLFERSIWTMNFGTSIIKIDWKMGKLWAFKEFNIANI